MSSWRGCSLCRFVIVHSTVVQQGNQTGKCVDFCVRNVQRCKADPPTPHPLFSNANRCQSQSVPPVFSSLIESRNTLLGPPNKKHSTLQDINISFIYLFFFCKHQFKKIQLKWFFFACMHMSLVRVYVWWEECVLLTRTCGIASDSLFLPPSSTSLYKNRPRHDSSMKPPALRI